MEITVLGPFNATENGCPIAPTAAKPRQVLALLAMHAGRGVTVPLLMEEVWGDDPPRSAVTTLQTYILQLRRMIDDALEGTSGPAAKKALSTWQGGYRLDIRPHDVDVHAFEQLAVSGRIALRNDDPATASRLLAQALALWQGPPLSGIRVGDILRIEVARLTEAHYGVLEDRITADLRLGRHAQLISELTALTERYPMNENLQALRMLALHRSGRSWQALDAYTRLRTTLIDELGLEPCLRLQRLQRSILASDPALDQLHQEVSAPEVSRLAG